eukprot:gb/GECG01013307.1/.p1 GENE.gb/GECG01013307.1/~~gb/GECG01013307.1/.p1  ORF type:complete len:284 (+),score=17.37 gb/GECG01013307.1/:1-852(+)
MRLSPSFNKKTMVWSYEDIIRVLGTLEGRDAVNQTLQYLSLILVPYFENLENEEAAKRMRWLSIHMARATRTYRLGTSLNYIQKLRSIIYKQDVSLRSSVMAVSSGSLAFHSVLDSVLFLMDSGLMAQSRSSRVQLKRQAASFQTIGLSLAIFVCIVDLVRTLKTIKEYEIEIENLEKILEAHDATSSATAGRRQSDRQPDSYNRRGTNRVTFGSSVERKSSSRSSSHRSNSKKHKQLSKELQAERERVRVLIMTLIKVRSMVPQTLFAVRFAHVYIFTRPTE